MTQRIIDVRLVTLTQEKKGKTGRADYTNITKQICKYWLQMYKYNYTQIWLKDNWCTPCYSDMGEKGQNRQRRLVQLHQIPTQTQYNANVSKAYSLFWLFSWLRLCVKTHCLETESNPYNLHNSTQITYLNTNHAVRNWTQVMHFIRLVGWGVPTSQWLNGRGGG